ncbi:beta strand repeat-containing protein [Hymenobacter edaphi]|uniref:beta strand repeat-containing protein n=1 Tax=Hymenobacter edaphi TaxID=2211146 RepID=UPI001401CE7A|nr:SBBP repeat-containing protein [Hymenobacter edaphi]
MAKLDAGGNWQWVQGVGGARQDSPTSVAVDASGNVYVSGYFSSPTLAFGATTLTNPGANSWETFVAKLDAGGNWLWAQRFGGTNSDAVRTMSLDASGNLYLAGYFSSSTVSYGATDVLTNAGSQDVFVLKINTAGTLVWARRGGGTATDNVRALAVDANGNVYLAGDFQTTTVLGSTTLTSAGSYDVFVAKLTAAGAWSWAVRGGSSQDDFAAALAVDGSGNVYITGSFQGPSAGFGSSTLANPSTSGYAAEAYVAKLSTAGAWTWAVRAGGTATETPIALVLDGSANVYVTGKFQSATATFGSTTLANAYTETAYSGSYGDVYIAKLSTAGAWSWAVRGGSKYDDYATALSLTSSGNVIALGQISAGGSFGSTTLTNGSIYVTALSSTGAWQWAKSEQRGTGNKVVRQAAVDASGNRYVVGYFTGTITLGSTTLSNPDPTDWTYDAFVAKMDAAGNWLWAQRIGGTGSELPTNVVLDANGNVYVAGIFTSSSMVVGTTTLTSSGNSQSLFVAKLDASGSWTWAQRALLNFNDTNVNLKVDAGGNAYLSGAFTSNGATFGTTNLTNATFTSGSGNGVEDLFIAKLDAAGAWAWAKRAGGTGRDFPMGLELDANGNAYVAGHGSSSTATFGTVVLTNTDATSGTYEVFVAKIDAAGTWSWAQQAAGSSTDELQVLTSDGSGNLYVSGAFYSPTLAFGSTVLTRGTGADLFVAKINAAGGWDWARAAGGTGTRTSTALAVDGSSNVYLAGYFQSRTATFGTTSITNAGFTDDVFVAKLTAAGSWAWAQQGGGTAEDRPSALAADNNGQVYVTGWFKGATATFGATLTNASTQYGGNNQDVFVARMDAGAGTWQGGLRGGGVGDDVPVSLLLDVADRLTVVVSARSTAPTFGSTRLEGGGPYYLNTIVGRISPASLLPVSLTDFTAEVVPGSRAVQLRWATAQEQNNAGFTVERSTDGRTFTGLGFVAGAGTSTSAHTYALRDEHLPAGSPLLYYRLVQRDQDGATTISPVRTVALTSAADFQVYPTVAAGDQVRYAYTGLLPAGAATLEVLTLSGQRVRTAPAGPRGEVSLAALPAGWYVLRLHAGRIHRTARFFRQ